MTKKSQEVRHLSLEIANSGSEGDRIGNPHRHCDWIGGCRKSGTGIECRPHSNEAGRRLGRSIEEVSCEQLGRVRNAAGARGAGQAVVFGVQLETGGDSCELVAASGAKLKREVVAILRHRDAMNSHDAPGGCQSARPVSRIGSRTPGLHAPNAKSPLSGIQSAIFPGIASPQRF